MSRTFSKSAPRGAVSIGRLAGIVAAPAFKRHGLGHGEIANAWTEIVGPDLAKVSRPERLAWPRGAKSADAGSSAGATLTVAVDGPRAIELQHAAPTIMEAVNTLLGYRAVARMRIVQAVPGRNGPGNRRTPVKPRSCDAITGIDSPDLRAALARLDEATERP